MRGRGMQVIGNFLIFELGGKFIDIHFTFLLYN